ncbi:ATP synthase F1 subunit delta [Spirobacillus cienkowskii]|uniref:ATP synthase subunit delta n=1 Tax=Spirobacillus cienkowskii TaxID=495820 RepID=A0A369KUK5_9BACT|nr:MAG: ATP synthase F1 subunit delta [Spirobacillus cienkowskii]
MKKFSGSLARRYGTALFECAVEASNKVDSSIFDNFVEISSALLVQCDKNMTSYFANPTLSFEEKIKLLDEILNKILMGSKISSEFREFLKIVIANHRFSELTSILKYFLAKADEYRGITRAKIVSAKKLEESSVTDFSDALHNVLNKKVLLETEIDESLRSGFIIKIGNTNVDASLRSRLLNLKESLS